MRHGHFLTDDPASRAALHLPSIHAPAAYDLFRFVPGDPAGDTVEQCGATIRVAAVGRGLPTRLDISLRRSLDDPELGWAVWQDHHLARFTPPAVGQSVELPWSSGPSGVF